MDPMDNEAPILAISDLRKRKGSPKAGQFELIVPKLELRPGELVAFFGESGCGKTTLLDMLSLISTPNDAAKFKLRLPGEDEEVDMRPGAAEAGEAARAAFRAQVGYVLQTGGLLPFLSIRQNARLPFRILGQSANDTRIATLADRLGIDDKLDLFPKDLSGGQRQRAAILRGLVHKPALILADEPTAAVDWPRAVRIMADFSALAREENVAVGIVTHDRRLVDGQVDEIFSFAVETSEDETRVTSICRPEFEIQRTESRKEVPA